MNTEIDISNVTLHTDRMILRPWRQTDLDDLYAYAAAILRLFGTTTMWIC